MARVFITGSSDGLGRMAAQLLIDQGHSAVLHARNHQRGQEALAAVPGAEAVLIADLASVTPDPPSSARRIPHADWMAKILRSARPEMP